VVRRLRSEFLFQIVALVASVVIVHSVYVALVRPAAAEALAEQTELRQSDPEAVIEQSLFVVIRDYEQEACFVLMLWALAIMGYKALDTLRQQSLLGQDLLPVEEGTSILPEDARRYSRPLQALDEPMRGWLATRALLTALNRFRSTANVQDVSTAVREVCQAEADRLDSELAVVRYIAWAIPSVGFIGTVRGIGQALAYAHRAVEGEIQFVTENLGTAFNSTFVALLLSIVLMFLLHQLQAAQERLVLSTQEYCDEHLIRHLQGG
jgi:biopolymer transport protein ExbB/TolQ